MYPCNECAKLMIQAGITEVVFHEDKTASQAVGHAAIRCGSGIDILLWFQSVR